MENQSIMNKERLWKVKIFSTWSLQIYKIKMFNLFSNIYNLYWKHNFSKKQYSCFGEDIFIKEFLEISLILCWCWILSPFFGIILIFCTKKMAVLILMRSLSFSLFNFAEMMIIISILLSQIRKKKKLNFFIGKK